MLYGAIYVLFSLFVSPLFFFFFAEFFASKKKKYTEKPGLMDATPLNWLI